MPSDAAGRSSRSQSLLGNFRRGPRSAPFRDCRRMAGILTNLTCVHHAWFNRGLNVYSPISVLLCQVLCSNRHIWAGPPRHDSFGPDHLQKVVTLQPSDQLRRPSISGLQTFSYSLYIDLRNHVMSIIGPAGLVPPPIRVHSQYPQLGIRPPATHTMTRHRDVRPAGLRAADDDADLEAGVDHWVGLVTTATSRTFASSP